MNTGVAWRRRMIVAAAALYAHPVLLAANDPADTGSNPPSPQAIEFFEQHVRPVLVKHCFECHGPKKQEADLRLDSREALLKGGASGAVVVPGRPTESRLIAAVGYADDDLQMPPDGPLPPDAVRALTEWVRAGASWPAKDAAVAIAPSPIEAWKHHWAAQPVRAQPLPDVRDTAWCNSPIDRFIVSKLEQEGLAPAPPADRRTLLRRATFDLLGLPPTREEIAAFEQDTSPHAFAAVIERLLASPHYGERWGRHWLDVARYADTKEYVRLKEERRFLYAFTYRDYVVRAFNADLPFNQFVTEQLAADLLPPDEHRGALAALGFLSLGRQFTGNPHDIIDDRIDVTTRGLLGLTVTCARCHDHKYDPIPTADYYSLYGVFASTESPAVPPLIDPIVSDPAQQTHLREAEVREADLDGYQRKSHDSLLHELRANVGAYLTASLEGRRPYLVPLPSAAGEVRPFVVERWLDYLESSTRCNSRVFKPWQLFAEMSNQADFSAQAATVMASLRTMSAESTANPALQVNPLVLQALERKTLTSMADVARVYDALFDDVLAHFDDAQNGFAELLTNRSFEQGDSVVNTSPAGWTLTGDRFCILSTEGATHGHLAGVFGNGTPLSQPPTAHFGSISQVVATRPGARYRLSFDFGVFGSPDPSHAQTIKACVFGDAPLVEKAVSATGTIPATFQTVQMEFTATSESVKVEFSDGTRNGESGLADSVLDNVHLVELTADGTVATRKRAGNSPLAGNEAELLQILVGIDSPTSLTKNDAVDFYLYESSVHDRIMDRRAKLNEWLAQTAEAPPRAHTLADRPVPCDPCVLLRGDPSRHGPPVPRQFLQAVAGSERRPFGSGSGRLELARVIVSRDNPLTARVLVNRVWLHHFGTGLVRSPSNFGLRGDVPTHPELLDYLAESFMAEGWSIKKLHRLMMLSGAYQQSSVGSPEALSRDPDNRLLSHMNRQRLDFESLRDAMLLTSGRLDKSIGGPSVELSGVRRTLYGYIDRQNLDSALDTFDFASPAAHSPTRHLTTVPQQGLFLLNSPFVWQHATAFAERADVQAVTDTGGRVSHMYEIALGRPSDDAERSAGESFIRSDGTWSELAQVLLLSNEFAFRD